jgi:FixJ family two-component response regulator
MFCWSMTSDRRARRAFDLVITDPSMPIMTGGQLVRALLALRPSIPVLVITGFSAGLTRQKVREMGVADLLQKPIAGQALVDAVHRALSTASA